MVTETHDAPARWSLSRRSEELELLDLGRVTDDELSANLADLARLNRLPGGAGASRAAIRALLGPKRTAEILDVGTGSADLPVAFAAEGWTVVGLDADPAVAARARERVAGREGVRVVDGDARSLPFDTGGVDVVHASLLLHHLDPPSAVAALREMARVARIGVVVNDLRRGWLAMLATGVAVAALGTCRTTRHDGLLSVRRAYTVPELDGLLADAGLVVVHRSTAWMPRVVTAAVSGVVR
jgi:SAM-dependent methyltransferase